MKRSFDIIGSIISLIFLWPVIAMVAVFIKRDSPGPIFYRGVRTGFKGKPFRIYKFRTMVVNAEERGGPSTAKDDPRLTRIGRLLRKYKIDELPQLLNILIGEMSFVGPRPQVEFYTSRYNEEEKKILGVRPGLTDYASIRFVHLDSLLGNENVDEKYLKEVEPEKNRLRLYYAINHTLWMDMDILIRTFVSLFRINRLWNTPR